MPGFHNLLNPKIWQSPAKAAIPVILLIIIVQEWRKGYFQNFRPYFKALNLRPYLLIAVPFFILFLLAFSQDRPLLAKVQALQGDFWYSILLIGRNIGENVKFWYFLILFYWIARWRRSAKGASTAFGLLLSSALAGLFAHLLKFLFTRARPYAEAGPYSFFNYHELLHNSRAHQSLPSGDIALVAAASGYLFFSVSNPFLRILTLLFPLLNAYARVALNRHWPSDAAAAMALGFMAAYFFWNFKKFQQKTPLPRV